MKWPYDPLSWAAHLVIALAHLGTIATGLTYYLAPSPSVVAVLPATLGHAWSLIFIIFGSTGLVFRLRRAWTYEALSLFAAAGGLAVWAVVVGYATAGSEASPGAALQTATRFVTGAIFTVGLGLAELEWVRRQREVSAATVDALGQSVTKLLRQQKATGE